MKRIAWVGMILFFVFSAQRALAATSVYLNSDIWTIGVGQETQVRVSVDSDQSVNAFRIVLRYPIDLIEYADWNNGGSIISHWVSRPNVQNGTVSFEGVVPGGFLGTNGLLATLTFRGVLPGIGWIHIAPDSQVFANDGQGTLEQYVPKDMRFRVVNASEVASPVPYSAIFKDTVPPEPFTPYVVRDQSVFGGKWFVAFEAQDKDSGIDHYDVAETSLSCDFVAPGSWREEQSPYVLSDQDLRSYVCVRAVDRSGNNRVESIAPATGQSHNPMAWGGILGVIGLAILVVAYNMIRSRFRRHA